MMRYISFLLSLAAFPAFAEVIYYGDHTQAVAMRSTQATVLKFDGLPVSAVCQPGDIEFEALDAASSRGQDTFASQEGGEESTGERPIGQHMIRARPLKLEGKVSCAFTLTEGRTVSVEFGLQENLFRPFIEFRSLSPNIIGEADDSSLGILKSLWKGKPMALQDITAENQVCPPRREGNLRSCRAFKFETNLAEYEVTFVGKNGRISAWTVRGNVKKDISFQEIADLKANGGVIQYSLTLPQKKSFKAGDLIKHHIIAAPGLTKEQLREVLL